MSNIELLSARLRAVFASWQRADLIGALDAAGVPCGAINTVPEVFEDPQVGERGMLTRVPHPIGVDSPQLRSPMRFTDAALGNMAAPPLLGQHGEEILRELGYDPARIVELQRKGTI